MGHFHSLDSKRDKTSDVIITYKQGLLLKKMPGKGIYVKIANLEI